MEFSLPPVTIVGSMPAAPSMEATSEVVVVFPCVPAIAMPYFILISSASISALGIIGIWELTASVTSGLSFLTAEE